MSLFTKSALAVVLLTASLGVAAAQQGGSRQIQVLPSPGTEAPAAASGCPGRRPAAAPAGAPAAAAPALAGARGAGALPGGAPVTAGQAPGPGPDKGPVRRSVEKPPLKKIVKPKPRYYYHREYGYRGGYWRRWLWWRLRRWLWRGLWRRLRLALLIAEIRHVRKKPIPGCTGVGFLCQPPVRSASRLALGNRPRPRRMTRGIEQSVRGTHINVAGCARRGIAVRSQSRN